MKRATPWILTLGLALLIVAPAAWAHYPMLLTGPAVIQRGDVVKITYTNGHPYADDRFPPPAPERVGVYLPGRTKMRDLIAAVTSGGTAELPTWHLEHRPKRAGDYIYSWHCGMFFEKPSRNVEDYAKLVIHVSDGTGAQVGWDRAIGDPLEIVPLTRPYSVPVGGLFRAQVLLSEQPFAAANVEAETWGDPATKTDSDYLPDTRFNVKTDPNGVFGLALPKAGWWVISCATDGGPGEQGQQRGVAQRATFWVHVGGTVWDRKKKP
jgi:cobalt/nickel transport protein